MNHTGIDHSKRYSVARPIDGQGRLVTPARSGHNGPDTFWAALLGLHGLALLVVFPLGPQETRLWHPGVNGVAALAAAYPLAACLAGLLARRARRDGLMILAPAAACAELGTTAA